MGFRSVPHVILSTNLGRLSAMRRNLCLVGIIVSLLAVRSLAQAQQLSCADIEQFLRKARIIKTRDSSKGVTHPIHATLESGNLKHEASIQSEDEWLRRVEVGKGAELNVHDYWGYNVAGYELAKLLSLNMVPPYVSRGFKGIKSSFGWWVPDVIMDEAERFKRKVDPPDQDQWAMEMWVIRVFNQLIYNVDDNLTNFLITKDWHLWMIDFSRAFRPQKTLRNPNNLLRCDRKLLVNLRSLNKDSLEQKLDHYLRRSDIEALLSRRDKIVKFFDDQIAQKGEAAVLFDLDRVGEPCGKGLW
jgi:hypothetical protein